MRPVIAIILSVLLFAGVFAYTKFAESVRREPLQINANFSTGSYSLEIIRTFDCVGDEDWSDVPSLLVKFRGKEIVNRVDHVLASEAILIDPLESVEQKENEIFVSANVIESATSGGWSDDGRGEDDKPPSANDDPDTKTIASTGALRVIVKRGDEVLADETFWLDRGAMKIDASVSFEAPVEQSNEDEHEH